MTAVRIFPASSATTAGGELQSSLPRLLQTPAGLALIEIQGTINHPQTTGPDEQNVQIGRIEFPDYRQNDVTLKDDGQGKWQKRVWLYVGDHQRLTGEVKKLPKPLGILRRRKQQAQDPDEMSEITPSTDDLEIAEVINWRIVFSSRPEPVGVATEI